MLDVVCPDHLHPAFEGRVIEETAGMQPLKDNGVGVGEQICEKRVAAAGEYNEWVFAKQMKKVQVTTVVIYPETLAFQCPGTAPAVTEAVKNNADPLLLQGCNLVKDIHHAAVVRWVGNVEAYEVNYFVVAVRGHKSR
jgi:hypothetical protein